MSGGKAERAINDGGSDLQRHYTVNPGDGPSIGTKYGDLNGDGYDDALVNLEEAAGNGYLVRTYVWLGGPNGPKQLTNSDLPESARCGDRVDKVSIERYGDMHLITVSGAKRTGEGSCAEGATKSFTQVHRVEGNSVINNGN